MYASCITLHILELFIAPPRGLPDIYPVVNVLISTPIFGLTWLWSIKRGVEVSWAAGGLGSSSITPSSSQHLVAPSLKSQISSDSTSTTASVNQTGQRRFSAASAEVGSSAGRLKDWQWPHSSGGADGEGHGPSGDGRSELLKRRSVGYKQGAGILRTPSVGATR